ncbi:MAG: MBL fold metallo-hydrolase [Bacillota bacterium]
MINTSDFTVKFWGVRGSLPAPGPHTVRFGGNTPCVQVQIGQQLVILDAGSGIHHLGQELLKQGGTIRGDILITHSHWDHIQGFPFFYPGFQSGNFFTVYGQQQGDLTLADQLSGQMDFPYFPIKLRDYKAQFHFQELAAGTSCVLRNGITVKTINNNHPNGGLSYRIQHGETSCCYVTDHEHTPEYDSEMMEFIQNSDLLIFDTTFTESEYLGDAKTISRRGWGHSTWQEAVRLAKAANVKRLILFHHAINRSDDELEVIEAQAQKRFARCWAAREGMVIYI